MAWTDEMIEDLKKMWHEGLTTGEIGKRLNVSKNSIVGKVHRLGLSGRPSPIKKKEEDTTAPKAAEKKAPTEKPKAAEPKAKPAPKAVETKPAPEPAVQPQEAPIPASKAEIHHKGNHHVSLTELDNHTCRWPIGDPKDDNFHFCGKKVKIGQTYCEEHSAVAYVKPSKK